MGRIPSFRDEWSDHSREEDGEWAGNPFKFFDKLGDEGPLDPAGRRSFFDRPKARPPSPSELLDVDSATQSLLGELYAATSSNSKFEAFPMERVLDTAGILARSDISAPEAFRATGEIARRYSLGDIRKWKDQFPPNGAFVLASSSNSAEGSKSARWAHSWRCKARG